MDPRRKGTPTLVALVSAHNEAHGSSAAVTGLQRQAVPPDRIVVICDNCTDETATVARRMGAEVVETVGNVEKKAGALNQALTALLPELDANDMVLIQDADSVLAPDFVQTAVARISRGADAVGGVFTAQQPQNVLEHFQANEYVRYARELSRSGRVMVLTGTAALVRAVALRDLAGARGRVLPGIRGDVYDRHALTEDNELTLALKSRGRRLRSPLACGVSTEVMPTLGDLKRQRVRWYRGAIDNLRAYGWTPVTRRYWGQQAQLAAGVLAMWLYAVMTALTVVTEGVLQVAFVRALWQSFSRAEARWYHVVVTE